MRVGRTLGLVTLLLFAAPWAATLTVGGLWLLILAPKRWPALWLESLAAGTAFVSAGLLVFGVCVADRLFPLARRLSSRAEAAFSAVLLLSCVALVWLGVRAFWPA